MKKTTKILIKTAAKYAGGTAKDAAVKFAVNVLKEATGMNTGRKREHFSDAIVMRSMRRNDRVEVLDMMRVFYSSDAVLSNGSDEIFNRDISECISDSPFAEGFVFEAVPPEAAAPQESAAPQEDNVSPENSTAESADSDEAESSEHAEAGQAPDARPAGKLLGYAMIAHSFSTEYGKRCVWIEDLYLKEEARGMGLASAFLEYIRKEYPDALHRLESENENDHAMEVYRNKGFSELPYVEMVRNRCESAPEDNECSE